MHKVLYISYDGMTDPLGQSQVLPYLKGLSKKGYEFHLISFEKPHRRTAYGELIENYCSEAGINWYPQNYTKKPPLLSTIKDVRKLRKVARNLCKKHQFSIVHCRSYIPALTALSLKKKYHIPFLFDMRGFWADERVEGFVWDLKNPAFRLVYNYFKQKEVHFFNNADEIVSLTENGKKEILSWKKLNSPLPITVIPCCVDTELFDPTVVNSLRLEKLRKALHIEEKDFILGYVGSIGTWYMLEEMLHFFKIQLKKNNRLKFLLVTGEPSEEILYKASELGIPKEKIITVSTAHKYVPLHIALFDFSIFFIRPTFSKKASSPTKQGELMAMGKPVICNTGCGDTDVIVKKYNAGICLTDLNQETFQNAELDPTTFDSVKIREGALDYFSLEKGVEKYHAIYERIKN